MIRLRKFPNKSGMSLIGVLVASAAMGVLAIAFIAQFKSQTKASRKIAAWNGVNDISHALDLLWTNPQCPALGMYKNAGANAVVAVSGSAYSLTLDSIFYQSGDVALTSLPNALIKSMIEPYTIASITMNPLGGAAAYGGTGFQYPFQMQIKFGSPQGPPPLPLSKYLTIYTDASHTVTGACTTGSSPAFVNVTGDLTLQANQALNGPTGIKQVGLGPALCGGLSLTNGNTVNVYTATGYYSNFAGPTVVRSNPRWWHGTLTCPTGYTAISGSLNFTGTLPSLNGYAPSQGLVQDSFQDPTNPQVWKIHACFYTKFLDDPAPVPLVGTVVNGAITGICARN